MPTRLQQLNDNNPTAHFLIATIDLGDKQYDKALDELKEAQKVAPNDPSDHDQHGLCLRRPEEHIPRPREMFQAATEG